MNQEEKTGWFHIKGIGKKSHYFPGNSKASLCGTIKITEEDLNKIKSGQIKLYCIGDMMSKWICGSCLRQVNEHQGKVWNE